LRVFEFNSNRKRMSVVIKHKGIVKVLMKGADSEIFSRAAPDREQPFLEDCTFLAEEFALDGFRTMAMAIKYMKMKEAGQKQCMGDGATSESAK
jgi:phospholipid-translocating ATPase